MMGDMLNMLKAIVDERKKALEFAQQEYDEAVRVLEFAQKEFSSKTIFYSDEFIAREKISKTDLVAEILKSSNMPLTPTQIINEGGKKGVILAHGTVGTILRRLQEKGIITKLKAGKYRALREGEVIDKEKENIELGL